MPRRRPAAVRGDIPLRISSWQRRRWPVIDGLSGACVADIRRLERARPEPGATAEAFWHWSALARSPLADFANREGGGCCGTPACCCDPGYFRDVLETVLRRLPKKSARELRVRVRALDERILAKAYGVRADSRDSVWWPGLF
ncbi:hypothetical protein AB0I10_22945 [Streptomyces sp. NPDC050636]|uniref:hypothetical protein n=1 Tax=Streptomyces sp. NPDC050636 TaxID=3154510 RepID=UPI00342C986D